MKKGRQDRIAETLTHALHAFTIPTVYTFTARNLRIDIVNLSKLNSLYLRSRLELST